MHSRLTIVAVALLTAGVGSAQAKGGPDPVKMLDTLIACDATADPTARLACFDSHVAELKAARQKDATLFQKSAPARVEFHEITSPAISVTELEMGSWLIVLADHSVWRTADIVRFEPRTGDSVHIVKGAFGGFLGNIGDERAVRLQRLH